MQFRLLALLVLATPFVVPEAAPVADRASMDEPGTPYATLVSEYDAALTAWKAEKAVADRAERKRLKDHHPVRVFWTRFQTAADAGEGRALLWQCQNASASELGLQARKELLTDDFASLFSTYVTEPWIDGALELAVKASNRRILGDETVERGLHAALEQNQHADVRAAALVHLGKLLLDSEDPQRREEGLRFYERCVAEYPESSWARTADERAFTLRHLSKGTEALDFEGTTIAGDTFRLSDHRGKVVVLDFFGFW